MVRSLPFALYHAFSAGPFGGAAAGIVDGATELSAGTMQSIASEIGAPATAFVQRVGPESIDVRFFSTQTEYGMCGHGTVALATHLKDCGRLTTVDDGVVVTLHASGGDTPVNLRDVDGRVLVMLDLVPSTFQEAEPDREALAKALGIPLSAVDDKLPLETASGDFVHLMVPIRSLDAMAQITPDFDAITRLSHDNGAQTVTVFTQETRLAESAVHCRDFCPVVGTPESPGAGTTNGALTGCLVRHRLIDWIDGATTVVLSEQGFECGRPSQIRSEVIVTENRIERLAVGGFARKSIIGELCLSDDGL